MINTKSILTGIKPTGTPHLGNLIGAILPMLELSKSADTSFFFIADLHALNSIRDPKIIAQNTFTLAATFIALGLDTEKTFLFRQSDIPELYQIAGLLQNITPKGLMNRAHAYKAQVDKNTNDNQDPDAGVNMGLYNYPLLMAADILTFKADLVPVGKDQKQHIEFARDIAGYFNQAYDCDYLKPPEGYIQEENQSILGLDGRKMSKSYQNIIPIFEEPKKLRKLIMKIITDSKQPEDSKNPDESTIYQIYKVFGTPEENEIFRQDFLRGGLGYGDAKQRLYEKLSEHLADAREAYNELLNKPELVEAIFQANAEKVRVFSKQTLKDMTKIMLGKPL